jgi:hypothetical protein
MGVYVARPAAEFMSVAVAVYVDAVGDTVSFKSAGFTIVAGWSSVTVGEHLPEAPATLHVSTVCAATAGVDSASAAQTASDAIAKRARTDRRSRAPGLMASPRPSFQTAASS